MSARLAPLALGGALLVAGACAKRQSAPAADQAPEALSKTSESGPVSATVTVSPPVPRLGDPILLTLQVRAQAGVDVEMPAFGEALGRFVIVDFAPREHTEKDGTRVAAQRYSLQAPMSGKQRIPPLRIEFVDRRAGNRGGSTSGDAVIRELLTEEMALDVATALTDGNLELRPPRPALATQSGKVTVVLVILASAGAAVAAALIGLWCLRRLRWRRRASAHEVAVKRLALLEARGFPGLEEADAWYVELSAIVRRYLEGRYQVRAPELTTEEFLREARRSTELGPEHRQLLSDFLARCDQVKFAGYRPARDESQAQLAAARRFVEDTSPSREREQDLAARPKEAA